MTKKDNPVRLGRLAAGLSQVELARRAGVHRSTVTDIEDGERQAPTLEVLGAIGLHLNPPAGAEELLTQYEAWRARQTVDWTDAQLALLHAADLADFDSFQSWRERMGLSRAELAKRLGVGRITLSDYENGARQLGMPDSILAGLMRAGVSPERAVELAELPPHPPKPEPKEQP